MVAAYNGMNDEVIESSDSNNDKEKKEKKNYREKKAVLQECVLEDNIRM